MHNEASAEVSSDRKSGSKPAFRPELIRVEAVILANAFSVLALCSRFGQAESARHKYKALIFPNSSQTEFPHSLIKRGKILLENFSASGFQRRPFRV